jgi:hypothetical protein
VSPLLLALVVIVALVLINAAAVFALIWWHR